jgi:hypothetical protein
MITFCWLVYYFIRCVRIEETNRDGLLVVVCFAVDVAMAI